MISRQKNLFKIDKEYILLKLSKIKIETKKKKIQGKSS